MTNEGTQSHLAGIFDAKLSREFAELAKTMDREEQRAALRSIVQIRDDAFLDRLISMDIGPDRALALRLIPLVFVAWADGAVDAREREAITRAAGTLGVTGTPASRTALETWLTRPPDPDLLVRWKREVKRIWNRFTRDEQWQMRRNLLGAAREVAEAAGGFLGLIAKVSDKEEGLLRELGALLD